MKTCNDCRIDDGDGQENYVPTVILCQLHASTTDLLDLVSRAYERFTDNDMQPPNAELRAWLDAAREAIRKATVNP